MMATDPYLSSRFLADSCLFFPDLLPPTVAWVVKLVAHLQGGSCVGELLDLPVQRQECGGKTREDRTEGRDC